MKSRILISAAAFAVATASAWADDVTIGMILPMTGPSASTGKQEKAGAELYIAEHGATVAGKTIKLEIKDDTGAADVTKRLAQEFVANDHAAVLLGFGLTPLALAAAPIATEAKVPEIVSAAATAMITEKSPFIVRTSFTLPQASAPMADWSLKNGIKKVVSIVTDYGPGIDAEKWFDETFKKGGGEVVDAIRVPLKNPDFAPFLQRVKDDKPDAVFVFVPSGFGAIFMKQFVEQGLDKAGIKLIGTGDVTDDDLLPGIGDPALGAVTTHHYSAAHDSPENKAFVAAFEKANGFRPNFMAVGGYDGMALIYHALEATKGATDGPALLAAMKGAKWVSPRGPV
jgi:branched-chain amino acid transport system substrate-binding protein